MSGQVALMSATQNFLTTVTGAFNQMTIPIASGRLYNIKAMIPYALDFANSAGITLGVTFPAARRAYFQCAFSTPNPVLTAIYAAGIDLAAVTSGTTVMRMFAVDGQLFCSGSGNLIFYAKAELANSTAKILDGGFVVAWNIGPQAI
jgi:hypothetical protein